MGRSETKEEKAEDIRKVKGNDAGLKELLWFESGVTDAEVEGLAEVLIWYPHYHRIL